MAATPATAPIVVADIEKNSREIYRVSLAEYRGRRFVDLRLWYADGSHWKPGPKGIAIKPDCLTDVVKALTDAGRQFNDTREG